MFSSAKNRLIPGSNGSSTIEFIFCAPLLLIVMFVAMEINERIEHRVTSAIAGGNAAWMAKVDTTNQGGASDLAKADVLGSRPGAGAILGVQADTVLQDSSTIMTYTDTKRRADAYTAKIMHLRTEQGHDRATNRARQKMGSSKFDGLSTELATAAIFVGSTIDAVTSPTNSWLPNLFLRNLYIEEQKLSWSVSSTGTTNAAIAAIEGLAETVGSDTSKDLWDESSNEYRILAHHSNYLRRDPAYHPDDYRNQFLFGMALGDDTFNEYNEKCFMNFEKKPCKENNGFYDYLQTRMTVVYGIKSFLECDFSNPFSAAKSLAAMAIVTGIEKLVEKAVEAAVDAVVKKATGQFSDSLKRIPDDLVNISKVTDDQIKSLEDKIDKAIDKAIEGLGSGL